MNPKLFTLYQAPPAFSITGGSGGGLTTFCRCPRRFFYSSGLRLAGSVEEHPAPAFGEALHAALPLAHFGDLPGAYQRFLQLWGDREGDNKRNPQTAMLILNDYMESHKDGRSIYTLVKAPGIVEHGFERVSDYEIPFAIHVGLDRPFIGRVDSLVKHRDTGEYWGLEWKTTSEMGTRFFDGFQLNPQVLGYTLALRSYGIPVRGVIVEGIKVSVAKVNAQETLCTPIYVTDAHLEAFKSWIKWTGGLIKLCEDGKDFPQDVSACTPYSQHATPGYQCDFMMLCQQENPESLIQMFSRRPERPFVISDSPLIQGVEGGNASNS